MANEDSKNEARPTELHLDEHAADAAYRPFPSFSEWVDTEIENPRWDRYATALLELREASTETLERANDIVKRAAAIETGAIERLYNVDRGFTITVATQAAMWESALESKDERARKLIEAQISAYDYVLDFATGRQPIAEAWIRDLHKVMCSGQETYQVYTTVGFREQTLPLGVYKEHPNHVRTPDGSVHSYAPVDRTPDEIRRLCQEMISKDFSSAHPVHQASYTHYALVAVHPFADGNGRVARALASVHTYKAGFSPVLVLAEDREEYFDALSMADQGYYQGFVDFTVNCCLNAMQLTTQSILAAAAPQLDEVLGDLEQLYRTRGGYTVQEVDKAGNFLVQAMKEELDKVIKSKSWAPYVKPQLVIRGEKYQPSARNYRSFIVGKGKVIGLILASNPPAKAQVSLDIRIELPEDCGRQDDLILRNKATDEVVATARVDEILPKPSIALRMRLGIVAGRLLSETTKDLEQAARRARSKAK